MKKLWIAVPLILSVAASRSCRVDLYSPSREGLLRLRGAGAVMPRLIGGEQRGPSGGGSAASRAAGRFDVLFLGSGVSTGVPRIGCIVRPDRCQPVCKVCRDALRENSRNRRGNVSILLRYWHADGRPRHVMVRLR